MAALVAGELSLNEVLTRLGYCVVNHRERSNGIRNKSVRKGKRPVRFPEGTLPGKYVYVTNLENTNADRVWKYLRAKGEIK